jgi:putative peptidoglycan binding protein
MLVVMRWPLYAIACVGCGASDQRVMTSTIAPATPVPVPAIEASEDTGPLSLFVIRDELPTCTERIARFDKGAAREELLVSEIKDPLVVIDLHDAWAPTLFGPGPGGAAQPYRTMYMALASERDSAGKPVPPTEALGELYGVLPSLAIVRRRLADDKRHACHAAIDSSPIKTLDQPFGQDFQYQIQAADQVRAWLAAQLERERVARKLPDFAALADVPALKATYARWKLLDDHHRGIIAAQKHLVCEGYMEAKDADGSFTWRTGNALELYQRRNFLMPDYRLDDETREALMTDSRELDFRLALRILRERVVDATGIIEDGTAGDGPTAIVGRMLDPAAMRAARGHEKALPNGAPDLVSAMTDATARALGWTGPTELIAMLREHANTRVAVTLPAVPAYHKSHMELYAEIDRGDVWYDEQPVLRFIQHRPSLVLYVDDDGTKRPLIRWPTTIGGWADQQLPGGYRVQRWKESDVGPRVWRELYAAPTWLPPASTPDHELVKTDYNNHWELRSSILGPGPHAAYGLVLLVHHAVTTLANGTTRFDDFGIGTHGSASVTSIVHGTSHGCHRLYNQLAVRLADFLLKHRKHEVRGQTAEYYRRVVHFRGAFPIKIDTRGFLYELTPPVPVNVLRGNIMTARKTPPIATAPARPL